MLFRAFSRFKPHPEIFKHFALLFSVAPRKFKIIHEALKDPNIRRLIVNYAGEHSIPVLKLLEKYSQDEEIANELNIRVSDIRAVLNKFNEAGFAYYDRTQDEETGWYYYKWNVDEKKFLKWIEEKLINEINKYKYLALEGEYYFCPTCGLDPLYKFDEAMDYEFRCPRCGSPLEYLEEGYVERFFPKLTVDLSKLYEGKVAEEKAEVKASKRKGRGKAFSKTPKAAKTTKKTKKTKKKAKAKA